MQNNPTHRCHYVSKAQQKEWQDNNNKIHYFYKDTLEYIGQRTCKKMMFEENYYENTGDTETIENYLKTFEDEWPKKIDIFRKLNYADFKGNKIAIYDSKWIVSFISLQKYRIFDNVLSMADTLEILKNNAPQEAFRIFGLPKELDIYVMEHLDEMIKFFEAKKNDEQFQKQIWKEELYKLATKNTSALSVDLKSFDNYAVYLIWASNAEFILPDNPVTEIESDDENILAGHYFPVTPKWCIMVRKVKPLPPKNLLIIEKYDGETVGKLNNYFRKHARKYLACRSSDINQYLIDKNI